MLYKVKYTLKKCKKEYSMLMHLSIVLNRLLFSINGRLGQVADVEQQVIITNSLLLSGRNNPAGSKTVERCIK